MSAHVITLDPARVVVLSGEIDLQTSPRVRTVLMEQVSSQMPLVIDMAAVEYIDSSGVAGLVEAFQVARKSGSGFRIAPVSEAVMRVLQLARLDKVFPISADRDTALAELSAT